MTIHYDERAQCGEPTDWAEPDVDGAAQPEMLAVRRQPSSVTWHLVQGRPLDAALCGERPQPRRGWWDLGPTASTRPAASGSRAACSA